MLASGDRPLADNKISTIDEHKNSTTDKLSTMGDEEQPNLAMRAQTAQCSGRREIYRVR